MVGSTISVLVDGVERISVTDTALAAKGYAGTGQYYADNSTLRYIDDWSATDAVTVITGTGVLSAQAADVTGAGISASLATEGDISAQAAAASGDGASGSAGAGVPAAQSAAVAGEGVSASLATEGAIAAQSASAAGSRPRRALTARSQRRRPPFRAPVPRHLSPPTARSRHRRRPLMGAASPNHSRPRARLSRRVRARAALGRWAPRRSPAPERSWRRPRTRPARHRAGPRAPVCSPPARHRPRRWPSGGRATGRTRTLGGRRPRDHPATRRLGRLAQAQVDRVAAARARMGARHYAPGR